MRISSLSNCLPLNSGRTDINILLFFIITLNPEQSLPPGTGSGEEPCGGGDPADSGSCHSCGGGGGGNIEEARFT